MGLQLALDNADLSGQHVVFTRVGQQSGVGRTGGDLVAMPLAKCRVSPDGVGRSRDCWKGGVDTSEGVIGRSVRGVSLEMYRGGTLVHGGSVNRTMSKKCLFHPNLTFANSAPGKG